MSTRPEERMVEIELGGIGNLSNDPGVVVLLLMPAGSALSPYPDGQVPVFPVPIDMFTGRLYLRRLYRTLRGLHMSSEVLAGYCRAVNITLDRVNIRLDESAVRTELEVSHSDGRQESLPVHLHRTVLAAVLNRIPVYVESSLLDRMAQNVRIQGADEWQDDPATIERAQVHALRELITSGATPDAMPDEQRWFLNNLDAEVLSALLDISVQAENFEWAAYLQKMKGDDEQ